MNKIILRFLPALCFAGWLGSSAAQTAIVFDYTGEVELYVVPSCVAQIEVMLEGAEGGGRGAGEGATQEGAGGSREVEGREGEGLGEGEGGGGAGRDGLGGNAEQRGEGALHQALPGEADEEGDPGVRLFDSQRHWRRGPVSGANIRQEGGQS